MTSASPILSEDFLFVENGLLVISEYNIKVSDELLLSAVSKHLPQLSVAIGALKTIGISEEHYIKLITLFKMAEKCIQKEIIGDVLVSNYLSAKAKELFELFGCDEFAKIRLLAIEIAKKCSFNLSGFLDDIDGHVRNFAISTQLENE